MKLKRERFEIATETQVNDLQKVKVAMRKYCKNKGISYTTFLLNEKRLKTYL